MTHHLFFGRCGVGNVVLTHDGFHTRALEQGGNREGERERERGGKRKERGSEAEKKERMRMCVYVGEWMKS